MRTLHVIDITVSNNRYVDQWLHEVATPHIGTLGDHYENSNPNSCEPKSAEGWKLRWQGFSILSYVELLNRREILTSV